jgi:drug/metabolite transporter (DMT)-like permease
MKAAQGTLLGLAAVIGFGLTLPATKLALPLGGPWFATAARAAIAGALAAALLAATRAALPRRGDLRALAVVAAGGVVGFPLCMTLALTTASSGHGAVVFALLPLATAALAAAMDGERPPARFWAAAAAGAGAVALWLSAGTGGMTAADAWFVLAVLFAAPAYAYGGRLARRLGGWPVIAWALVLALPLSLPAALLTAPTTIATCTPAAFAGLAWIAAISQLLAFVGWYRALALGGTARTSQLQLLQPFVTIAAGAVMLGERPGPGMLAALAAVLASLVVGRRALRLAAEHGGDATNRRLPRTEPAPTSSPTR